MNKFGYERSNKDRGKIFAILLVSLLVILGISYGVYKIFLIPSPVIEGVEAFRLLPADKTIILKVKNTNSIEVFIEQDNKKIQLLKENIPKRIDKTLTLQIKPKDLGLKDGTASVIVKAQTGILKKIENTTNTTIDTVPPGIEVLKAPPVIHRGTGGFALLRARDADSVFVKLVDPTQARDGHSFRAFKTPTDENSASLQNSQHGTPEIVVPGSLSQRVTNTYFVFFPAPIDIKDSSIFYAVAEDAAGNQQVKALPTKPRTKRYGTSSINIEDSFINIVVYPLLNEINLSDPVDAFRKVNEDWRKANLKKLFEIAQNTEPEILWNRRFLQLKNTKVMATYGDNRTYFYKGKPISKSAHLGYDLASIEKVEVEAANSGVVRFAGDLGIYGNTIIIDHGLGLMSLYGHLSMIMVEEGQAVQQSEIIGRTGSTGLAGGDHLHFGILIHGYEVSPLHWWDPNWVKVNVTDYLNRGDREF